MDEQGIPTETVRTTAPSVNPSTETHHDSSWPEDMGLIPDSDLSGTDSASEQDGDSALGIPSLASEPPRQSFVEGCGLPTS